MSKKWDWVHDLSSRDASAPLKDIMTQLAGQTQTSDPLVALLPSFCSITSDPTYPVSTSPDQTQGPWGEGTIRITQMQVNSHSKRRNEPPKLTGSGSSVTQNVKQHVQMASPAGPLG